MELVKTTIGELLENMAIKSPDNIFLKHNDENFTFREINEITKVYARVLYSQGFRKNDRIGIFGVNSISWVLSYFAIQKLGATAVLINSCYKEKELIDCITMTDMKAILYTKLCDGSTYDEIVSGVRKNYSTSKVKMYNVERSFSEWMNMTKRFSKKLLDFECKVDCDDISTILFTSGTTNACKGVMLTHFSMVNNAREVSRSMRWGKEDTMCLVVPLFHCFGITVSLLSSLVCSMKISILDRYKTLEVLKVIQRDKCSVLNGVPSMFLAMIRNKEFQNYDISSLKSGIIAGSPIFENEYREICLKLGNIKLQPSYGMTEASPCVAIADYEDSIDTKSITAGKVVEHVQIKIVDIDTKKELGTGEIGEIFVKGYNITKGYLTNDKVVCDAVQKDGWLKSGDLGFIDKDGYLRISGRRKNLIIRGGENISPTEIENYIKKYRQDIEVLVMGVKSEVIQEEIVACIEGKWLEEKEDDIREFLKKNISRYKVPKYFLFFEKFPRTATGKVDEKAIRMIVNKRFNIN